MAATLKPGRVREAVTMIEKIEIFFAGLSEMASGIPTLVMVPLIMILAAIGTAMIVCLLLGVVRLIFGQRAVDFIRKYTPVA